MNKVEYPRIGESVYTEELENGLRLFVVPRPGFSNSYALFATRYGGADQRFCLDGEWKDSPAGVAHFLEHKMFDTPDGGNALALLSANGANPNAFTGSGMTAYYYSCTDGFFDNLRTLLNFVSVPYFTEESVAKEQGIIGQEISMGDDDADTALYYGLLGSLYERHPVRQEIAGTAESIAQITAQTLYDCHRAFYRPSNMVLCCVGDMDPQRVRDMAREILPPERGDAPRSDYGPAESLLPHRAGFERAMAVSAPQFLIGAKAAWPEKGEARLRVQLTARLALSYLVGESSPFFHRLYAGGLLRRDFSCELSAVADTATVIMGGESREPESVLNALRNEVSAVAEQEVDEQRLERCRRALYGGYLRSLANFSSVAVNLAECYFDGCDYYRLFEELGTITAAECAAFLRETLAEERLALSVVRPL